MNKNEQTEGGNGDFTIIVRDFNTPILIMDRTSRQNIIINNNITEELSSMHTKQPNEHM